MELTFTQDILSIVGSFMIPAIITVLSIICLKDLISSIMNKVHKGSDKL